MTLFDDMDLFCESSASLFGLSKKEIAIRGAVAGAGIDALFVGSTLFLGTLIGGVGAYFGFEKLSDIKVLGQKMGKKYIQIGPMKNKNFPYVLLGRALYHTVQLVTYSHARQENTLEEMKESFQNSWLRNDLKVSLDTYHKAFSTQGEPSVETIEEYEALLRDILDRLTRAL